MITFNHNLNAAASWVGHGSGLTAHNTAHQSFLHFCSHVIPNSNYREEFKEAEHMAFGQVNTPALTNSARTYLMAPYGQDCSLASHAKETPPAAQCFSEHVGVHDPLREKHRF